MLNVSRLKDCKIFEDLDDALLQKLAPIATIRDYQKNQYIKKEGEESKNFYIVLSGKIVFETAVYGETVIRLGTANKDDYFGESALIPPYETTTDRMALEESKLIVIDGVKLREMLESDYAMGFYFMRKVSQMLSTQLHRVREQLIHSHYG